MNLAFLKDLLNRENQSFICVPADTDSSNNETFTARIYHEVTAALVDEQLGTLRQDIGDNDQLFEFLSTFGSLRLYCDSLSDSSAYYIAHPDEWNDLGSDFNLWLNDLSAQEKEELLPDWIESSIIIGEIPSLGNYFVFVLSGLEKGKVFEFEHDGFEFVQVGENLNDFLSYICTVTDDLIKNISSHTRYSDGKTDIQWLAASYKYD